MLVAAARPTTVSGLQPHLGNGLRGGAEEPVELCLLGVAGEVVMAAML